MNITAERKSFLSANKVISTALIIFALAAFVTIFVLANNAYFRFADTRFPNVGTSTSLANLWGVVSRAHLLLLLIPLVIWKPRLLGFQIGKTWKHYRMLLIMLAINCGVIAGYLLLTGSTPYSGNQWVLTEVITVPLVEEVFWRGLVFAVLLLAFRRIYSERISNLLAIWFTGLSFGLLHATNLVAGVPLQFVVIQTLNAMIWGVVYGFARSKTESIYPPIILHSAMNLVVVLF